MDDRVAGPDHRQEQGRDRRHARGEAQRILGIFPQPEAILENLLVGAIEARINQTFRATGTLASDAFEVALAGRGAFEHEGRGEEDRRLQRSLGQRRIIAVTHHQGAWLELLVVDRQHIGLGPAARRSAGQVGFVVHSCYPVERVWPRT